MKLYIRQKALSWRGRFFVRDADGKDRYYAEGDTTAIGQRIRVFDMDGCEVISIQQKRGMLTTEYLISRYDEQVAVIQQTYSWFRPRYEVSGLDWVATGSLLEHRYVISKRGQTLATIRRKWLTWGDSYELDVEDEQNVAGALAVLLTIDFVLAASIK